MSDGTASISPSDMNDSLRRLVASRSRQEQQYSLVRAGYLVPEAGMPVITKFTTEAPTEYSAHYPPDCKWWPIRNRDSQPFNPAKHWRLKPIYFAEDQQVIRLYPVVAKSWEHA